MKRTGAEDDSVFMNLTSSSGDWSLDNLDPGQEYKMSVLTRNEAGDSVQRYNSSFLTYQSEFAESRVHISDSSNINSNPFVITPILGALIGVGVALTFVTMTIIIVICCKTNRNSFRKNHRKASEYTDKSSQEESEQLAPDVVPSSNSIVSDSDYSEYMGHPTYSSHGSVCPANNRITNPRQTEQHSRHKIYTLVRGS